MSDTAEETTNEGSRGVGYRRLEGELTALRAEFESLADESATSAETPEWVERGRTLLDRARRALDAGNIEQGCHHLHAAERLGLYGLDPGALEGEARETLTEAEHAAISWRADAIRERLTGNDGSLREITSDDLLAARDRANP